MEPFDTSECPRAVFNLAVDTLLDTWTSIGAPRRSAMTYLRGLLDPRIKLERKTAPGPVALACVRWFSKIDQESNEPAGYFVAAWRISRFGDISGPFADPPGVVSEVKYACTIATEFKINFAFGEGVCALESFNPSGDIERSLRHFGGMNSDVLGDVIGGIRRDRVKLNQKYDPCLPRGWQVNR
jgi:hypothetical protein